MMYIKIKLKLQNLTKIQNQKLWREKKVKKDTHNSVNELFEGREILREMP